MPVYHIHVDAAAVSLEFESYLTNELKFVRSDFDQSDSEAVVTFTPARHFTLKLQESPEFKTAFETLLRYVSATDAMTGYIEGEIIPLDKDIEFRPFDDTIRPPFRLKMGALPPNTFRETEVHITLAQDSSDPRLLERLSAMGFFPAWLQKYYGTAQIFTAQGMRCHIDAILPPLLDYLARVGGARECSVKEERIVNYWLSGPDVRLAPVIDEIEWSI